MKLFLGANLSPEVTRLLKEARHDAIHVGDIGLLSAPDPEIMQAAVQEDRILLTADADFGALLALGSLASPSVLLLRSALEKGAIASLTRDRMRVRPLPIAVERGDA